MATLEALPSFVELPARIPVSPSSSSLPSSTSTSAEGSSTVSPATLSLPSEATAVAIEEAASVKRALESLEASPPHLHQLQEYQKHEKDARRAMQRKGRNLAAAQSEIYALLGLFSVFQGVIFAALAQASVLTCAYWWCPFSISLAVSCGTLLALHQRLQALARVRTDLRHTQARAEALYSFVDAIKRQGDRFHLAWEPMLEDTPSANASAYNIGVFSTVALVSLIILYSCPTILCYGCTCRHN